MTRREKRSRNRVGVGDSPPKKKTKTELKSETSDDFISTIDLTTPTTPPIHLPQNDQREKERKKGKGKKKVKREGIEIVKQEGPSSPTSPPDSPSSSPSPPSPILSPTTTTTTTTTNNNTNKQPQMILFGHPGIEKDAFFMPKRKDRQGNLLPHNIPGQKLTNFLDLELELEDGKTWKGKGSILNMPWGDQRYLMQCMGHVVKKEGKGVESKLVRFAGEYAGFAEELCRSSDRTAQKLSEPWTRVMEPKLSSSFPIEGLIRDNDPFVLTGGEFRYGLCKQWSQAKLRTLPVGSIIVFCGMNHEACYLDTVFVVGQYVDVVDEEAWQKARKGNRWIRPMDFRVLSREELSHHQGAGAWTQAIDQGSSEEKNTLEISKETTQTLKKLCEDYSARDPDVDRLALIPRPSKPSCGPLSGRLYFGREYDSKNERVPYSFVPVWEIPAGKELSTNVKLMKPRPKIDLKKLYKVAGCAGQAPRTNAQLVSKPINIGDTSKSNVVFEELKRQVLEQGFELGVRFAPPSAMDAKVEKKMSSLELAFIRFCENAAFSPGFGKGSWVVKEGRPYDFCQVLNFLMGPFIRVRSGLTGKVEEWSSLEQVYEIWPDDEQLELLKFQQFQHRQKQKPKQQQKQQQQKQQQSPIIIIDDTEEEKSKREEAIDTLSALGFPHSKIIEALNVTGNDVNRAANHLLGR